MLGSVSVLLLFKFAWLLSFGDTKYIYIRICKSFAKNQMTLSKQDTVRRKILMSAKTPGVNKL